MTEIWHNPACSKSRATLALLEQHAGSEPLTIVRYLDAPPTAARLREVLALLGIPARALVRSGEASFATLALENADEDALIAAMTHHPELIQRPVVITARGARIGRPPEQVLEVLEEPNIL